MKPNTKYPNIIFTDSISNKTLSTLKLSLLNSNRFLNTYESMTPSTVRPILYQSISTHYNNYNNNTHNEQPKMTQSHSKPNHLLNFGYRSIESPKNKIHSRHIVDLLDYDDKKEMKKLKKKRLQLLKKPIEGKGGGGEGNPFQCTEWTNTRLKDIKTKMKFLNKIVDKVFPHIFISKHQLELNYHKKEVNELKKKRYETIDVNDLNTNRLYKEKNDLFDPMVKVYSRKKNIILKSANCFKKTNTYSGKYSYRNNN